MALTLRMKRSQEEHQHRWHPHIKSITNSLRKFWSILKHKPTTNRTKSLDQHGYYTLFDHQITKRKTLAIRKLLTQTTSSHSTLLLSFDPSRFSNPPPAPSFYLDQPYPLYWDIAKELRPDSILQIVCQSAEISEGTLAITAHPSRQNAGVIRRFRVETLAQDFEIILPQTIRKIHQKQEDTDSTFAGSAFLAQMPSWAHRIILKADPEDLTRRLLPAYIIPPNALHVATCFWAWLCVIDDLTEDGDCFNCIEACIETLSTVTSLSGLSSKIDGICLPRDLCENSKLEDCKTVISAFHDVVSTTGLQSNGANSKITAREVWKADFWLEVLGVVQALQAEKSLQARDFNMREWLELRFVTISARPFFVLLRVSLGLPPTLEIVTSPRVKQMQILVQAAMGLQNDLLGWQKDHAEGNTLNAVEVLIRYGLTKGSAFAETLLAHNDIVRSLLCLFQLESNTMGSEPRGGSWRVYLAIIISFCEAMAEWMLSSRRYRTEEPVVPGLFRLMYHDSNDLHEGVPQL